MTREEIDALEDVETIKLRKPIVLGKLTVSEFTLREPTIAQLKEITQGYGVQATELAIVLTAGVPAAIAAQIPAREMMRAKEFFDRFLESPDPKEGRN